MLNKVKAMGKYYLLISDHPKQEIHQTELYLCGHYVVFFKRFRNSLISSIYIQRPTQHDERITFIHVCDMIRNRDPNIVFSGLLLVRFIY